MLSVIRIIVLNGSSQCLAVIFQDIDPAGALAAGGHLALVNASAHEDLAARQASFDLLVITVAQ